MSQEFATLVQLALAGLTIGSIYVIVAVGFNVIYKCTGSINFAQGEYMMMGGMVAAAAYTGGKLPVWLACVLAAVVVTLVGLCSERLTVRSLKNPNPMLLTLISIGVAMCAKSGVMLVLGKNPAGFPAFSGETSILVGGVSIQPQALWVIGVALVFMLAIHLFFEHTLIGKSMRACAADRDAAALVGINVKKSVMWSFALAAFAGGLAGIIITPITFVSYDAGTMLGFKGFSAAMLGGLGSLQGAMVGGLLLGLLESLAGGLLSSQFKDAVSFVCLLLVLFLRPHGLLGKVEITKV